MVKGGTHRRGLWDCATGRGELSDLLQKQNQAQFLPVNVAVGAVLLMEQLVKQQELGVQVKAAGEFEVVYSTGGHVWTEMSNANVDTAENERKLRWVRAFNRYEVTGTRLESVVLCTLQLLPAPSTSCSGADNGHPYTRQGTGLDTVVQKHLQASGKNWGTSHSPKSLHCCRHRAWGWALASALGQSTKETWIFWVRLDYEF